MLNAADFGDATTRSRFFLLARFDGKRIEWPEPTHSRNGADLLNAGMKRWRSAREIIDWNLKGRSILNRKRPLSPKTLARALLGLWVSELEPQLMLQRLNDGREIVFGLGYADKVVVALCDTCFLARMPGDYCDVLECPV